ncbi:DUF4350 domain-containing protein [Pedobacter changchengzhani]|uniref:DUF4350 domain-containing protein n=1 Tax=Pedobacter changchengzhani TaxID=2529274 RepID=A0A4R5MN75_9SPHI|nr:DUF4350 domain-containing protein [Pedobacter changchengzhani]TDG37192.1 DUF4350 domain-containing protein [Pedobacter changchengzhani]
MKGYKIYLAIGVLLIAAYLVAQYNKPSPTDWTATYVAKDKIPFGTYILRNRINDIIPNAEVLNAQNATYNTFKDSKYEASSYIIVASSVKIDKTDFEQLKLFMEKGNNVFIAAYEFGPYLNKILKLQTATVYKTTPGSISVNFTNPALSSVADYRFEKDIGNQYFQKYETKNVTALGKNALGNVNFISKKYKKGNLYLIAEPGFYTNFNLLDKDGADYAAKSLSYLRQSKTVLWDEYNTLANTDEGSLLRVFFKHPELKYAYYLTIIGLIIFVLYDMKRRQRIIPIMNPFTNSSVDFVKVVGSVYFDKRNNLDIARKKITFFLAYLRARYHLKTNEIDGNFSELLSQKTGINLILAKTLTNNFIKIPLAQEINDKELIDLNDIIEQFYKNTQPHGATI